MTYRGNSSDCFAIVSRSQARLSVLDILEPHRNKIRSSRRCITGKHRSLTHASFASTDFPEVTDPRCVLPLHAKRHNMRIQVKYSKCSSVSRNHGRAILSPFRLLPPIARARGIRTSISFCLSLEVPWPAFSTLPEEFRSEWVVVRVLEKAPLDSFPVLGERPVV